MTPNRSNPPEESLLRRIAASRARILDRDPGFQGRWLLVGVARQYLYLLDGDEILHSWPVSTAAVGVDNRQDSGGTPSGLHRIDRKVGEGAEPGMIFTNRQPTGILWRPCSGAILPTGQDDLILTRILTLAGLEDGVNRGPGVDSKERYIYIHGTNHEDGIGSAVSGGCVRMANPDVVALFEQVAEGDPVVII